MLSVAVVPGPNGTNQNTSRIQILNSLKSHVIYIYIYIHCPLVKTFKTHLIGYKSYIVTYPTTHVRMGGGGKT